MLEGDKRLSGRLRTVRSSAVDATGVGDRPFQDGRPALGGERP